MLSIIDFIDCPGRGKQHRRNVMLSSFQLNGYTKAFHQRTQKLEPPCTA